MGVQEINILVTVKSLDEIFFQVADIPKRSLESIITFRPGKLLVGSDAKCKNCSEDLQVNFFWTHAPFLNESSSTTIKKEIFDAETGIKVEDEPEVIEVEHCEEEYLEEATSDDVEVTEVNQTPLLKSESVFETDEYQDRIIIVQTPPTPVDQFHIPKSTFVNELQITGVCDFCGYTRKTQTNKAFLKHCASHLIRKDNDKSFHCLGCGSTTELPNAAASHALCCPERESFRDQWEELSSDTKTKQRVKKKKQDPKTSCEICFQYIYRQQMKDHLIKHANGDRPYFCNECGKNFAGIGALKEHLIIRHFPHLAQFKCSQCPSIFTLSTRLDTHMMVKHKVGTPVKHSCPYCSTILANAFTLKSHIRNTHTDVSERVQYKCDTCDKVFYGKVQLKAHELTHLPSDQRPHKCVTCGKSYISNYRYKNHLLEHTNPEQLLRRCEVCGKAFKYANSLKVHMRIHTGEQPYECKICERKFSDRGHHRIHMKQHESNLGIKLTLNPEERRLVKLKVYQPEELISTFE